MREYGREQRIQPSRAIANNATGSKQLKRFVDNRNMCYTPVQRRVNGTAAVIGTVSAAVCPAAEGHIETQIGMGNTKTVTIDRLGIAARRRAALRGVPAAPAGQERDEWVMSMFLEGGAGAHIQNIPQADNRSAGATIGNALRPHANGIQIDFTPAIVAGIHVVQL